MSTTPNTRINKRPNAAAIKVFIAAQVVKKSSIAIIKVNLQNLFNFVISERELKKYIKELPAITVQTAQDNEDEDEDEDSTGCGGVVVVDAAKIQEMINNPLNATNEIEQIRCKLIAAISSNLDANLLFGNRLNGEYLKMLKTIEDIRKMLDIESSKNTAWL